MNLTDSQSTRLQKLEDLVGEVVFSLYYEEGDRYPEVKELLTSLFREGVEVTTTLTPYEGVDHPNYKG